MMGADAPLTSRVLPRATRFGQATEMGVELRGGISPTCAHWLD